MSNNDYVIFIKKKRGDFEPVDSAETKEEGIEAAKAYLENPKVLEAEVVYMPNDDYDVEEVVWNSSKNIDKGVNEELDLSGVSSEDLKFFAKDIHNHFNGKYNIDIVDGYKIHIKGVTKDLTKEVEQSKYVKANNLQADTQRMADGSYVYMLKKQVTQQVSESVEEDSAWSEEEVRAELIKMTNNFKKNEGEITTWYEEEKEHIKNILDAAGYQVEISDGRKNKDEDMNWVITFVKKVNESLTEDISKTLTLKLLSDDGEEEGAATFSVEKGKDFLLDSVKKIGWGKDVRVPTIDPPTDADIVKLEVFTTTIEGGETEVFIDINENLDLIYCGKFKGLDYTSIDKIIKVIEDWSEDATIEEALNFDVDRVQKRIARVSEFNNGSVIFNDYEIMTSDEAEEKAKQMSIENPDEIFYVKYDDIMNPSSDIKWKNGEQVDHLGNKLNSSTIKEELGQDTLDFDKDKKLTIREMYDFLLKSGMANGCDIILDWDNDSDLSDPKTAIEWLDLIIETYYDLDSDLRYMNADDEAERNMDQVIVPLEDFRNELNEKGLAQLNNIYYQVISYNNDSGDDDFDDYGNYGAAEAAFENWVNDYKEDGVDGAVELLQVDDNKGTSKQLKYWSSEDDNAWKFDESLSNNCCDYQAAYEKLDKFMSDSEEDMNNFYEARTKEELLDVLENAIVDEDRFISYAGEGATLEGFAEYILDNKLNESMQEETVKDYGCDMCGKRVPEDQVFWFYGGEIGLCEECYDKTSSYVRSRLEDGDFSFLDQKD